MATFLKFLAKLAVALLFIGVALFGMTLAALGDSGTAWLVAGMLVLAPLLYWLYRQLRKIPW